MFTLLATSDPTTPWRRNDTMRGVNVLPMYVPPTKMRWPATKEVELNSSLARIIHVSEDKRSLLCYKHVVETMFAVTKEASECLTIAQHSVCCSRECLASL